jgi:hypothetical protein
LIFAILSRPSVSAAQRSSERGGGDVASQNRAQNSIARWKFQRAETVGQTNQSAN